MNNVRNKSVHIAGVVILYEPPPFYPDNINSFINQIDILIVINNGRLNLNNLTERFPHNKIYIRNFPDNIGVASALNVAANLANHYNMDYLLMMDQDSYASPNLISDYLTALEDIDKESLGIISPSYVYKNYKTSNKKGLLNEANAVITSGSFLNLNAYSKAGPFADKLFIDYVDFEYCLRLKSKGFKIFRLSTTYIKHELGKITGKKILSRDISVTHHSPERYYYRTRNRFYYYKTYFKFFPMVITKDLIVFFNEILKILLYENNKMKKIGMIFKGFYHFFQNKYGRIDCI